MADSSPTTNADLLALSARLRDRADQVIADRSAADDMRAAAGLATQWANFREGWDNPGLSKAAICELDERLNDWAKTGAAVVASDVFLAACVVDMFCRLLNGESLPAVMNEPVVR